MRTPRPYQVTAIRSVHEAWTIYRSALLVLATGLGKTAVASWILEERAKTGRILWIAHRRELIAQAKAALESVGLKCEIEMGQEWAKLSAVDMFGVHTHCVIATVQTLQRARLKRFRPDSFDTIVIDETHHATAQTYRDIIAHFPEAKVLGLTATPDRGDKVGLGNIFECSAFEYDIRQGVTEGFLVPITQKRVECADIDLSDVKTRSGDLAADDLARAMSLEAVQHQIAGPLAEHAGKRPTIVFTSSVEQAHALADIMGGYTDARCAAIDGTTEEGKRADILRDYSAGAIQFLFNCAVLTEGFDAPLTACVAMARPTKSRALYTQCIGRGTRLAPGKADLLVLDFVGNSGRHKLVSPIDVLAGDDLKPDERDEVERKVKAGMPTLEALEEAKREAAERDAQKEAEKLRKAKIKAQVDHRVYNVDPFGVLSPRDHDGPRVTDGQAAALERWGVPAEQARTMSKRAGSKLLDTYATRKRQGLCSPKMANQLGKRGLDPNLPFAEARMAMDALANNRWQVTSDMQARWGVKQAAE